MTSANLVATSQNGNAKHEIILSAHIDSAGTPGAQDNASGVAVLLELARTLRKLNLRSGRFVLRCGQAGILGSSVFGPSPGRPSEVRTPAQYGLRRWEGHLNRAQGRQGEMKPSAGVIQQTREYHDKATNYIKGDGSARTAKDFARCTDRTALFATRSWLSGLSVLDKTRARCGFGTDFGALSLREHGDWCGSSHTRPRTYQTDQPEMPANGSCALSRRDRSKRRSSTRRAMQTIRWQATRG